MKRVTVQFTGMSRYSQSRPHRVDKLERETAEDYEARTWKNRLHLNDAGEIVLPAMAIKNCLAEAAKYLGKQIPGKGKSTYTKHFEAGILAFGDPVIIGNKGVALRAEDCASQNADDVQVFGDWIFTPSDGVPGSGKRVYRCYPVIKSPWTATMDLIVVDDIITQPVLEEHLKVAGTLIGVGRFRVRNRGLYGMFSTEILGWAEEKIA